jgi:acyl-CoA hydrolase/GNAT superfamily N-acetyltransferase
MRRNWKPLYQERLATADQALEVIRSGQNVLVGSGCAAPQELLRALVKRAPAVSDVELFHLLTFGIAPYVDPIYEGSFRHNAFFIGSNVRQAIQEGRADYTPIFLSEIPNLFFSNQLRLDAVLVMLGPPDSFGYCSLGIHPDIVMSGIETAKTIVAQVNRHMPRVHGDTFVHVSKLDKIVEHDEPLVELPTVSTDETSLAIARHVAALIEDESTLQLGIGKIPNAVLSLLADHEHLGLHTEMFSDGVIDLCEKGVITNEKKSLLPGKAVASFAMGTKQLYDYLDDNPFFDFRPTEFVNSPLNIARNHRMVSINSALQVDITGQVSADSIGTRFYSGIGGQIDFIRGAAMSPGGKPIIALPSTAKNGTVSRIVPELDPGAGVVTSRGDVHYVVTEYGAAYLHGKTVRQRAMALIESAHPDFRTELRDAAVARHYVPVSWELPSEAQRYPIDMEELREFRRRRLLIRPLRSADADRLMDFFYSHTAETIYQRYRYLKKSLSQDEALRLCTLDYGKQFALAVFDEAGKSERIVAVGRYSLNEKTGLAETAMIVHEDSRRLGIGRHLQMRLREYAERCGIVGFTGSFEPSNVATLRLHRRLGDAVVTEQGEGRYVAYFARSGKAEGEEPGEERRAPATKKAPKSPKKRASHQRKGTPRRSK